MTRVFEIKAAKRLIAALARPVVLNYALPALMILLVAGTLAQKSMGLYEATRLYFAAPVIWAGFIPLPGLPVILAVILISLSTKLFFKSPWTAKNAGIIIIHTGVFMLLAGGILTGLTVREGFIDLVPGENRDYVADYHQREFVMIKDGKAEAAVPFENIARQENFGHAGLSFKIEESCRHCALTARKDSGKNYRGMAEKIALNPAPLEKIDEENMAGLTLSSQGGAYILYEGMPERPVIAGYELDLRRQRRALPFRIELVEFRRAMHPGTATAKNYESTVLIEDGGKKWRAVIGMNEPLRYKGFVFYQASFVETAQGDVSVLAVVHNPGRTFPYLAGLMLCTGILIHLIIRRKAR